MGALINGVLTSGLGASISTGSKDSPEKIVDAAKQFEGLLIGEMFKAMHEDGQEGWLGSGEDDTASSAMGMADEYLAQAIAKHGGFGLAQTIARQLTGVSSSNPATPQLPDSTGTLHTDLESESEGLPE